MTGQVWLAGAGLAAAAAVLAVPGRRRRRFADISGPQSRPPQGWAPIEPASSMGIAPLRRRLRGLLGLVSTLPCRRASVAGAALLGAAALPFAGPVGALIVGTYAGLGIRGLLRREAGRIRKRERANALDALCALAADLRAGVPPLAADPGAGAPGGGSAGGWPAAGSGDILLDGGVGAAWRLAEETGAPLADLIERVEADARAMDRAVLVAAAQAAGARVTAWLLAGLPLGGIALGYGIGVDPLRVLLHTTVGAACAVAALVLQVAGLMWAERLTDVTGRVA